MRTLLFLHILFSFHITALALTLPSLVNVTAEGSVPSNDHNATQNSEAHCTQDRPTESILPELPDCVRAVRLLPRDDYIGIFHVGGEPSLWKLPRRETYGTCTAAVILNEDFDQEMGSWDDVRNAAIKVVINCRKPFGPQGEQWTGGWITAGAENGLVIVLRKPELGSMNGTAGGTSEMGIE